MGIAREAIADCFHGIETKRVLPESPELFVKKGAFVTLTKGEDLRGCIGRIEPHAPLFQTVAEMAKAAAFQDPRFSPIVAAELPGVVIEISVLSLLERVKEVDAVEVGRHGLVIRRGSASGLLLPQVAVHRRWSKEEFLGQLCLKAVLPIDAWREAGTELFAFTAEVFSEKDV